MATILDSLRGMYQTPNQFGSGKGVSELYSQPSTGIDFLAFERGAQMARDQSFQQKLRENELRNIRVRGLNIADKLEQRDINRTTQQYLSTVPQNRALAIQAGVSPDEFLVQQLRQINNDEAFQNFSDPVKQNILHQLTNIAKVTAGDLYNTGEGARAQNLARAFGMVSPINDVQLALRSGNVDRVLEAYNAKFGQTLVRNPDGTINFNGVNVEPNTFMSFIAAGGGNFAAGFKPAGIRDARNKRDVEFQALMDAYNARNGTTTPAATVPATTVPAATVPAAGASGLPSYLTQPTATADGSATVTSDGSAGDNSAALDGLLALLRLSPQTQPLAALIDQARGMRGPVQEYADARNAWLNAMPQQAPAEPGVVFLPKSAPPDIAQAIIDEQSAIVPGDTVTMTPVANLETLRRLRAGLSGGDRPIEPGMEIENSPEAALVGRLLSGAR